MTRMTSAARNKMVDELLMIGARPFHNRLQAAIYTRLMNEMSQEKAIDLAIDVAKAVVECVYCDVDRKPYNLDIEGE